MPRPAPRLLATLSSLLIATATSACGDDTSASSAGGGGGGPGSGGAGPTTSATTSSGGGGDGGDGSGAGTATGGGGAASQGGGGQGGGSTENPLDVIIDVPLSGPYGSRTFTVPAQTNWVNTGLYLRAGQTATMTATGTWSYSGQDTGPAGLAGSPPIHGCVPGAFVARSGLNYEETRSCIGEGGTFVAPHDGIVYVGASITTDLGETYEDRRKLAAGELQVTVTSDGDTAPTVAAEDLASTDLAAIASGWLEITGERTRVTVSAADAMLDLDVAAASIATLDAIHDQHALIRDVVPSLGQRVRFFPDPDIGAIGYMLAGNPVRCVPDIMSGFDTQRILRAAEPDTDIWGFAHELGHDFTFSNGTWVYMYANLESWPNLFSIHALRALGRTENQPNIDTYCDGRAAYLAAPTIDTFNHDPFVQLCFLMELTDQHGWELWQAFYDQLDGLENDDVVLDPGDPEHRALWGWIRDRLGEAAGEDVTPHFVAWSAPLP